MNKNKPHKDKPQLELDDVASANELTGSCLGICTDEETIRRYHEMFNKNFNLDEN